MRHEYAKSLTQFDLHIPILDAGSVEKDSVRFLDVLGSFWDSSFALKRFGMVFSVLTFFTKFAICVLDMRRSLKVVKLGLPCSGKIETRNQGH